MSLDFRLPELLGNKLPPVCRETNTVEKFNMGFSCIKGTIQGSYELKLNLKVWQIFVYIPNISNLF